MAGAKVVQFVGPSYHLADKKAAVQSAINVYPQHTTDTDWMMQASPGEVLITTLAGEVRGMRNVAGRLFVAAGSTLYEKAADDTFTTRGTLSSSAGFVGMSNNSTQLAIVDGASLYILTLATNVLTPIISVVFRAGPIHAGCP